ncbi:MAG: CHASE2 domain-containing protein [Ignavibacteriaceae bacterium]|nr:CHASE2 domain-containing protein [Ignavibacteriaceae bacterium]
MAEATTKREVWSKLLICFAVSLLVIVLTQDIVVEIAPLKEYELNHLDERFKRRGAIPIRDSSVIVLEISRNTYQGIPEAQRSWPWPRAFFARVIDNLTEAGVKAIGIDIIMGTPNSFSPEDDSIFIDAIRRSGKVVVAGVTQTSSGASEVKKLDENFGNAFYFADTTIGIVKVIADDDGVHRRYLPFMYSETTGKMVPTFGFALLNTYYNLGKNHLSEMHPGYFQMGETMIPRFTSNSMVINFYGKSRTFPHRDFLDVLDDADFQTQEELEYEIDLNTWDDPATGLLQSGFFKDKIVLIGSTVEEDRDVVSVSFSEGDVAGTNTLYGVEFHANAIQNVLSKDFLSKVPVPAEIAFVLFFTFAIFFGTSFIRDLKLKLSFISEILNFALLIGLLFAIREVSFYMFSSHNLIFAFVSSALALILGYFSSTAYYVIVERRQKAAIKGMFSQYVDSSIVEELISEPGRLRLGGDRKNVTVFFSDIAGFSTFSETKAPEELVSFLNEYLSAMTEIVMHNKGTLDKYIGDAVMAFWGAPVPLPNHAHLACQTALEQLKVVDKLREKWRAEGQPLIQIRIGINTGDVVVGNVGGNQRFDYTVMGDNVNLASRLEGANKPYGTRCMLSESTYEMVSEDFVTRLLDFLVVKGKTKPVKTYELIAAKTDTLSPEKKEVIRLYNNAMDLYHARNFAEANKLFNEALKIDPEDGPSLVYAERSAHYIVAPPEDDWDGVFKMTTK